MYPEFQYRRPPPSYNASMQDFQHQLVLAQSQRERFHSTEELPAEDYSLPALPLPPTDPAPAPFAPAFRSPSLPCRETTLTHPPTGHIPAPWGSRLTPDPHCRGTASQRNRSGPVQITLVFTRVIIVPVTSACILGMLVVSAQLIRIT